MCTDSKRHFSHTQEDMEEDMQDGNILFHYPFVNFDYAADVISQLNYTRKQAVTSIHVFAYYISPVIHFICYSNMEEISATGNTCDFYSLRTFFTKVLKKVFRVFFIPTMQSSGCTSSSLFPHFFHTLSYSHRMV